MKKALYVYSMLLLAAIALLPFHAVADTITFNLTSPNQTATAGSTVSFNATFTTPGTNTGEVDLIGDSYNVSGFGLPTPAKNAIDDSAFFDPSFVYQFNPGATATELLFTFTLPRNATGLYTGFFEVQDGNGIKLASANFNVNVPATVSAVPEPGTWMLLATGMACGLMYACFARPEVLARNNA